MKFFEFGKQRKLHSLMLELDDERTKLLKKNLVPDHTKGFLMGQNNLVGAANESLKDTLKEFVCPFVECGIRLHNRMLMRQHLKWHTERERYREKIKDADAHKMNSPVYLE